MPGACQAMPTPASEEDHVMSHMFCVCFDQPCMSFPICFGECFWPTMSLPICSRVFQGQFMIISRLTLWDATAILCIASCGLLLCLCCFWFNCVRLCHCSFSFLPLLLLLSRSHGHYKPVPFYQTIFFYVPHFPPLYCNSTHQIWRHFPRTLSHNDLKRGAESNHKIEKNY